MLDDFFIFSNEAGVLVLQLLQLLLADFLKHAALNFFFFLGKLHNLFIFVSDLLEVLLHNLIYGGVGGLAHGVIQFQQTDGVEVRPRGSCVLDLVVPLLLVVYGMVEKALEVSSRPSLRQEDTQVTLALELGDTLLEGLIDILHFEVLLLHRSEVFNQLVGVLVV